jgi:hypothetical protein
VPLVPAAPSDLKIFAKSTWWLDIASIVLLIFGLFVMTYTAVHAFN